MRRIIYIQIYNLLHVALTNFRPVFFVIYSTFMLSPCWRAFVPFGLNLAICMWLVWDFIYVPAYFIVLAVGHWYVRSAVRRMFYFCSSSLNKVSYYIKELEPYLHLPTESTKWIIMMCLKPWSMINCLVLRGNGMFYLLVLTGLKAADLPTK